MGASGHCGIDNFPPRHQSLGEPFWSSNGNRVAKFYYSNPPQIPLPRSQEPLRQPRLRLGISLTTAGTWPVTRCCLCGKLLFHPLTQLQRDRHFAPGWPWGQLNVSVTLNSFIPIDGNVKASNSAEGNASERHGHNPSSSRMEHQQFY